LNVAPALTLVDQMLQLTLSDISLFAFDVVVWTDGFVSTALGTAGLGIHAVCRRCLSSSSLSYSADPISSAESFTVVHGVEWCHSYLTSCHFKLALFLTDSQSALALLSMAPAFFQPKSFWDN